MTDADKQRIVDAINRRHGTSVPLVVVEMAVASELTSWAALQAEASRTEEGRPPMR